MNKLSALIATCDVIRGIIAGSRGRRRAELSRKVPHAWEPPSPEFHWYFAASEGSYPVCSQAVFSSSRSHSLLPCVPFSLSHFPVGCYCRVSSPSLIKSFVLRRRRALAIPVGGAAQNIRANISRINVDSSFLLAPSSRLCQIHIKVV